SGGWSAAGTGMLGAQAGTRRETRTRTGTRTGRMWGLSALGDRSCVSSGGNGRREGRSWRQGAMRDLWARLGRRVDATVVEVMARGLVCYGLAWLLARAWRDQLRERRRAT